MAVAVFLFSGCDESGECVPDCAFKECGDDGCGGSCGVCTVCGVENPDACSEFGSCYGSICPTTVCGDAFCSVSQVCVHSTTCYETCAPPSIDDGLCPDGSAPGSYCFFGSEGGCLTECSEDDSRYACVDIPEACDGIPSCVCLPTEICNFDGATGECGHVQDGVVSCMGGY